MYVSGQQGTSLLFTSLQAGIAGSPPIFPTVRVPCFVKASENGLDPASLERTAPIPALQGRVRQWHYGGPALRLQPQLVWQQLLRTLPRCAQLPSASPFPRAACITHASFS